MATPDRKLSFAELDRLSDRVATTLLQDGARRGSLVGIAMWRGWEQVVAALGVLKAGAAYVPIDPDLPQMRIAQLIELAGCDQLITHPDLDVPGVRLLVISDDQLTGAPVSSPETEVAPGDLAYVLFTSGSTGVPKGVMIEHASAANTVLGINRQFAVGPGDAILGVSSFSFDPSVYDTFGVLAAGATLVLPDPALARDPAHWARLMDEHGVTLWISVPALLTMLVSWHEESGTGPGSALRLAITGGEVLPLDLPERAGKLFAGVRLVNVYGPTETSICSTSYVVDRVDPAWTRVPCGKPLPGQGLLILDESLRPVPHGEVGEICITGKGLARGYWRNEELTRQSFIDHPRTGQRIYRTGDRGRLLLGGDLEFLGREDQQVKVRGYRIELGEIETALRRSPEVEDAVVVVAGTGLAGFVVAAKGVDPDALMAMLRTRLPSYMVPDSLTVLDGFPLTGNGKVDRRALAASVGAGTARSDAEPPRPGVEQQLAADLAELLGQKTVGRAESFWDLGGNSLLASRFAARLRRRFGADIPIGFVLTHPTIARMTDALAELPSTSDEPVLAPSGDPTAPARLSHGQEQVWFLDQLTGGNRAYHAQCTIRFAGRINAAFLQRALTEVVRRHEILRTTFHDYGAGPVQVVHEPAPVPLPVTDLRELPESERTSAADAWVKRETSRSFDPQRGPLVAWRLVRVGEEDWLVTQTEHHLVHDGWSAAVLWREIEEIYRAQEAGRAPHLPELPIQYRDFAVWQRQRYASQRTEALTYWRQQLDGVRSVDLTIARRRPPRQTFVGSAIHAEIPVELYARLREFSRAGGGSLFATMFAAFGALLHRYSGERDLCVGTSLANRDRHETENLIGMLVNMVALRSTVTAETSFRDLVGQIQRNLHGALSYQYAPFDDVVRELEIPRDLSRNPLVQACFSFNDSHYPDFAWPRARGTFQVRHNGTAKFDLNVIVAPTAEQRRNVVGPLRPGEALTLVWEYNTDIIAAEDAQRMLDHYVQLLASAVATPDRTIDRLSGPSLLDTTERALVTTAFNDTAAPYPDRATLHELVAEQVARTPDATAVELGDDRLSYADLDARAEGIARRLRAAGVRTGHLVAVCAPRCLDLPAALLGVLKAGAAYVPLDPGYPTERLTFMLTDSNATVVLTQERLLDRLPSTAPAILLDDRSTVAAPATGTDVGAGPDDPAYVIYTSGSTGKPKGAVVSHRAIVNRLDWMRKAHPLGAEDAVLQKTPTSFDVSVWELFLPLLTGARLVLAEPNGHRDVRYLRDLIVRSAVTIAHFVPSMLALFLAEPGVGDCRTLRRVICSGEVLPPALARRCLAALPGAELHNLYGPTEAAVDVTAWRCSPDDATVPIGRPIQNTQVYVLDEDREPVPIGMPGELYIGGVQLAAGYHRRSELTAERFVEHPERGRLYRTGDRARWRRDGAVEYLGRLDYQVKLRGQRIELGEIEAALRDQPGVTDAVVLLREDRPGDQRLVGYLVGGDPVDIWKALGRSLPEYLVPSALVTLGALPLTPNGKLDRAALPPPGSTDAQGRVSPPETAARGAGTEAWADVLGPLEQQLAEIWADVLGRNEIGADDDFFAVGGHSLLAIVLVSRIRSQLNLELELEAVFDQRTIRNMVSVLAEQGAG